MQTEGQEAEERPGMWCTAALWEIWRQTKRWLWITESVISVDRKEPQFWYLTPGKKASEKKHSQDILYQTDWQNFMTAHATLMVCWSGFIPQIWLDFLVSAELWLTFEEECYVLLHIRALAVFFKLCIYLTLFKTIYTLTHCYNINCCFIHE